MTRLRLDMAFWGCIELASVCVACSTSELRIEEWTSLGVVYSKRIEQWVFSGIDYSYTIEGIVFRGSCNYPGFMYLCYFLYNRRSPRFS